MDYEERNNWEARLREEYTAWTPRVQRAQRTAHQILGLIRDYIPSDRECLRRIEHELVFAAFVTNAELVCVPPEQDAWTKQQTEKAMLDAMVAPIVIVPARGQNDQ